MTENKVFEYTIAGKKYTQQTLVLGQFMQLTKLLRGVEFDDNAGPIELMNNIGNKLPGAIAIVLKKEDQDLKDKNIEEFTSQLEFEINTETSIKILEDFFLCNPIALLLERLTGTIEKLTEAIEQTGLKNSASLSPGETSPEEKKSSGDTHSKSASLT